VISTIRSQILIKEQYIYSIKTVSFLIVTLKGNIRCYFQWLIEYKQAQYNVQYTDKLTYDFSNGVKHTEIISKDINIIIYRYKQFIQ